MDRMVDVTMTVNGEAVTRRVEARQHLVDFLREELQLTGTHVGCEHGVCGACTVRVEGQIVRGCLMLAAQADGLRVDTIEGLAERGEIADLQAAFLERNALQCGYLHARHAAHRRGAARDPATPDRARRSARTCRATTAGAPATRRSSMRSRRSRPAGKGGRA